GTLVFVLIVLVLFSFTFDPTTVESRRFGPGLLWLALLFAGSLMLHPSFTREQSNETLVALRMAPIEPVSIVAAKILANFCFLLVAELLLLPLLTPALVASAEATAGLFEAPPVLPSVWMGVLAAFDTIFLTVTWLFGEYLLEE